MMVVTSPPLCFKKQPDVGDKLDTSAYSNYLIKGSKVKYVVWPALLLEEDGPVLRKGVAECEKENRDKAKN